MKTESKFLLGYAAWVIGFNTLGLMFGKLGPAQGKKAKRFPYFDNWTYTHFLWGGVGGYMGLKPLTFTVLNFLNEFGLEPLMAYAHSKGATWISFASEPDPFYHKVADFLYAETAYAITYYLKHGS